MVYGILQHVHEARAVDLDFFMVIERCSCASEDISQPEAVMPGMGELQFLVQDPSRIFQGRHARTWVCRL